MANRDLGGCLIISLICKKTCLYFVYQAACSFDALLYFERSRFVFFENPHPPLSQKERWTKVAIRARVKYSVTRFCVAKFEKYPLQ